MDKKSSLCDFDYSLGDNIAINDINIPKDIDVITKDNQERARYIQDTKQRRTLVLWMLFVVSFWLLVVVAIVILCGLGLLRLSDIVLSSLLATTTINVLGLANIILKGLFGNHSKKKK